MKVIWLALALVLILALCQAHGSGYRSWKKKKYGQQQYKPRQWTTVQKEPGNNETDMTNSQKNMGNNSNNRKVDMVSKSNEPMGTDNDNHSRMEVVMVSNRNKK